MRFGQLRKWPAFADRLVCPCCRAALSPGEGELLCTAGHGHRLPLVDGLPVLRAHEVASGIYLLARKPA